MYRIKNGERWIKQSIESIYELTTEIVILDDGSTDKTVEICSSFDKVVDIYHQENLPLDESRDRNKLLQMALKRKPDLIFILDDDEILIPGAKSILEEEIDVLYPDSKVFAFQLLTLWDGPNQIRIDSKFGNFWGNRLFRVKDQPDNLKFESTPYAGNLHCGGIPPNTLGINEPIRSNVKILHLASIDEKIRQQKYEWYNKIDPDNIMTDNYIHMIKGEGRFSGPDGIELMILPPQLCIDIK